jgi:hypothetical protein
VRIFTGISVRASLLSPIYCVIRKKKNSLANQLSKNRDLTKLTSPRAYMRTRIVVAIGVSM